MRLGTRHLALLLVLLAGLAATQLWGTASRNAEPASDTTMFLHHVDVGGWYRATAAERVVRARYDLSAEHLAETLPLELGPWQGQDLGPSEEIAQWYDQPELQLRRRYEEGAESFWLTAIGARGAKSFRMFEHTPPICYAATGWRVQSEETLSVALASGELAVQAALFEREGITTLVYYWYQWDSPSRDAADGIVSWRLTTSVRENPAVGHALLASVVRELYVETIPWRRQ